MIIIEYIYIYCYNIWANLIVTSRRDLSPWNHGELAAMECGKLQSMGHRKRPIKIDDYGIYQTNNLTEGKA